MLGLLPAFVGGLPGGVELLVILFVVFLLFGVPVALALFLGYQYVSSRNESARVEELERELDDLKAQVENADVAPDAAAASEEGGDE